MHPYVETNHWFKQRNLWVSPDLGKVSREVEVYLLVMFALRPQELPVEIRAYLADRYFSGHVDGNLMH